MKQALKTPLIVVLLFFVTVSSIPLYNTISSGKFTNSIRSSAPLGYSIHIDGNWSATETFYDWCTGAGTIGNPYVIQDIEIDANGGFGILIGNSTDYFRIENVSIYNAQNSSLIVENVDNGHLKSSSFSDNDLYGIYVRYCNDFTIEHCTIDDNGNNGIYFNNLWSEHGSNFNIWHNSISGNTQSGIRFYYLDYCDIWNNTLNGGQAWGLEIDRSNGNTVRNNTIIGHSTAGIYLESTLSGGNNITSNHVHNNGQGLHSFVAQGNSITYNNFTGNTIDGMFYSSGSGDTVKGNLISNNQNGIYGSGNNNIFTENTIRDNTNFGINLQSTNDNSKVYLNAFITNNIHAECKSPLTWWNSSQYGNYWDTYSGIDSNVDGIGDTLYSFGPNVTDYSPLLVSNVSLLNDFDLDSLSDYQELNGGLNQFGNLPTNPYNPDSDEDGLDDGEEITGSLNVLYANAPSNPNDNDTDGDGYTDFEEITGSVNPFGDPMDPTSTDSDGDLVDDNDELMLGFDPTNSLDYPKPDLIILTNYSLDGSVISITIKNQGVWRASNILIFITIASFPLTLYNNSLTRFNLDPGQTKEVRILKSEFSEFLVEGESYFLSVYIDPLGEINETSEDNNIEDSILYVHSLHGPSLGLAEIFLIVLGSIILLSTLSIGIYYLTIQKDKKMKRKFQPLQLMVLEKHGSSLLFTHRFKRDFIPEKKTLRNSKRSISEKIEVETPEERKIDEILAAGAFSGIQSLLKSILQTEKGINEISHGEYTIYFIYGKKTVCVLIAFGKYHKILPILQLFSAEFEREFEKEIIEFDGRVDVFSNASFIAGKHFADF